MKGGRTARKAPLQALSRRRKLWEAENAGHDEVQGERVIQSGAAREVDTLGGRLEQSCGGQPPPRTRHDERKPLQMGLELCLAGGQ